MITSIGEQKHTKKKPLIEWTFLNYIFVCLEDHKWNIIGWIIINIFGIFFINCKFYMLKAWYNSKMFLHAQSS
jgi:hypothetical protein